MPEEADTADAVEIVPDERSLALLLGLIAIEFATLLSLLVWMR